MVWLAVLILTCLVTSGNAVELTFELPDNAKECFHEDIEKGVETTLEFQVKSVHYVLLYVMLS